MMEARLIRDRAALEALAPAWWELWRRADATPFQSPAWLLPWWQVFSPGDLLTVAVERDGELVGLAPFYVEDGALGRRLLPLGVGITDYLDVLLHPDHAAEAGRAIVAAALAAGGWDSWELEELRPEAAAFALPCPEVAAETVAEQSPCPTLALSAGDLAAVLPRTKRRKINLARNRAARRGGARVERAEAATLDSALGHLVRLHGSRWRSRGEDGVLADDPVQRFHRIAAPALLEAGLLRLLTLSLGDAVVAAYYGLHWRQAAYAYLIGFDPDYTFESPGVLLTAHAVEAALAEGARDFHFLRGDEPYKYDWGAVDRWNRRRSFRRPGARHAA
ncbi:MAG TPA: GNAT family N-acetyltransferase [Microvirga sp.]|jgi:CelD/BcsL family acetyltransferase involved in cellulose biosynthesis|nr:GNAT family N-acetyltransferase [Microvirga sp.]